MISVFPEGGGPLAAGGLLDGIADGGEDLALAGDYAGGEVEGGVDVLEGEAGDDVFWADGEDHAFEEGDIGDDEDGDVVAFFRLEGAEGGFEFFAAGLEAVEIAFFDLGDADEEALFVKFFAV